MRDMDMYHVAMHDILNQGFLKLTNLVAISRRYYRPLVILKAGCIENNGKNWLLNPVTSSQSEGYSSIWLVWLVCREPLFN